MDFFIYLKLENYLAQWYIHESGGLPVRLKRGSAESDIIELFLSKQPAGALPDTGEGANVRIALPWYSTKDIRTYNYLPPRAKAALARTIYVRFRVQLWEELHRLENTECTITDLVYAWMEKHGIECDEKNWETIRQMYFRKRRLYRQAKTRKNRTDFKAGNDQSEYLDNCESNE